MADKEFMQHFNAFLQQKGFVWGPSPEIYGGMAGFYTYAPLGKLLKVNIENAIRKVFYKHDIWEIECPIIMPKIVWEASGHLSGFTDPMIKCSKCKAGFRVDSLIEEKLNAELPIGTMVNKDLLKLIEKHKITCPNCKGRFDNKILKHNLMMQTTVGVDQEVYNRPETATTTYLPFPRLLNHFREKLPFGIFQIGKAFRNEISPRQSLLRMREFTQAEAQIVLFGHQKKDYEKFKDIKKNKLPLLPHSLWSENKPLINITAEEALKKNYFKNQAYAWTVHLAYELFTNMGIPEERMRLRQHDPAEKAFYAEDAWDIEIKLNSFGWFECCGIHDRTDYDLKQHAEFSKKKLVARDEANAEQVPHVLEIAFGIDRPPYALLDIFYEFKTKEQGKTKFNIPYGLAPVKVAVFPLMKKDNLPKKAKEIFAELSLHYQAKYDESGSIGKRYLREDESGTPFCITIDYDSLEKDTVTIRDRNTAKQEKVKTDKLIETIKQRLEE